jgi:hypothetical protein
MSMEDYIVNPFEQFRLHPRTKIFTFFEKMVLSHFIQVVEIIDVDTFENHNIDTKSGTC